MTFEVFYYIITFQEWIFLEVAPYLSILQQNMSPRKVYYVLLVIPQQVPKYFLTEVCCSYQVSEASSVRQESVHTRKVWLLLALGFKNSKKSKPEKIIIIIISFQCYTSHNISSQSEIYPT